MGRIPTKRTKERIVEEILLRDYDKYYRLAYSYVKNEMDAGDIVQNGAYQAIRKAHTLREEVYAATWIYRIMLNEIFKKYQEKSTEDIDQMAEVIGQEDSYENVDLKRALNNLSKEDKAVVELKYFEEMKLSEIAEVLGENLSTIKSRLYRSLKKLKLELE